VKYSHIGNIEGCYFSAQCDSLAFSVCLAGPNLRCDCFWKCLADTELRQCLGLMRGRVLVRKLHSVTPWRRETNSPAQHTHHSHIP